MGVPLAPGPPSTYWAYPDAAEALWYWRRALRNFEIARGIWLGTATERRLEHRKAWAWDALAATRGCDVVFADPDNGLEPRAGLPRQRLKGPKHAYFDELAPYLDRNQSLVVYHHLHRGAPHASQVQDRLSQLQERLGSCFGLRYRPGSGRVFLIVPSEEHWDVLHRRAERLVRNRCWSRHFELIDPR